MKLLDSLAEKFSQTGSSKIGKTVDDFVTDAISRRRPHERRWYDNNFFDDGYHFRVVSRKTGQVIDTVKRSTGYTERAIPRASRQIRGVSNLLFAAEPYPVVYPKRITISDYPKVRDPQTGQMVPSPEYQNALDEAKEIARKQGTWLSTQWDEEQELPIKMIDMILKAARNSVAYLQVYTENGKICTEVFDAFDIILYGDRSDLQKLPFITKAKSMDLITEIPGNKLFDPEMVKKLKPDNKYATSEIKDAYMRARFGAKSEDDTSVMVYETFMKEILTEENYNQVKKLGEKNGALDGKEMGDTVMRHCFTSCGVTLLDEYVDYDEYPFAELRFEPGPLYQVPFIERFIPQNKSLDIVVTRLEKWVNAMIVGVYQKRKGENFQISNFPGGQVVEYETTPLSQMSNASVGNTPFNVVSLLDKYIEEQGASTAAGGQLPPGVKAGIAIESLKATEYANLKIPTLMLKKTLKKIAELMLERADKDFLEPQEVESLEDGEPQYFDVIGQRGVDLFKKLNLPLPPDVVPLSRKTKVRIEIEPGLGLTMEGKKEAMKAVMDYFVQLADKGYITKEAMNMLVKRFMETFGYGSTQELMEALETGSGVDNVSEEDIMKMKVGLAEVLKDVGAVGPEFDQKLVDSTKLGTLESLKESGMLDGMNQQEEGKSITEELKVTYKDLPEDVKRQVEEKMGLVPSKLVSPAGSDQMETEAKATATIENITNPQQELALKEKQLQQSSKEHDDTIMLQAHQSQQSNEIQKESLKVKKGVNAKTQKGR